MGWNRPSGLDSGAVLVALAMVPVGTTGTAQELGPEGIDPVTVGVVRLAIGGPLLLAVALARGDLPRSIPPLPLLVGAVAMAAYQPFFFGGVHRTGVAVGTVVAIGSAPAFAGAIGAAWRGERPGLRWYTATALAVAGGGLLLGGGEEVGVDPTGVVLALGAGLSYAVFAVAVREVLEEHPPVCVVGLALAGAALLLAPAVLVGDPSWAWTGHGALVGLHLGVVATAAAYILYGYGARSLPVATTTTVSLTEPLTAALLGWLLLGEQLTSTASIGGCLLAGGLLLAGLRVPESRPAPRAGDRPG